MAALTLATEGPVKHDPNSEPSIQTACQWWRDLHDVWTPIGWKNHMFRFNVLWNGTIYARPDLNRRTEKWKGQGAQIAFAPTASDIGGVNLWGTTYLFRDDGMTRQGWNDTKAPVLWTEFWTQGLVIREEVFGHIPGGADIERGDEPLFAWVRYRIHDTCAVLPLEDRHSFVVKINAPHFRQMMCTRGHDFRFGEAAYPRGLSADASKYSARKGLRVVEPRDKVRMAIAPRQECAAEFAKGMSQYTGIEESFPEGLDPGEKKRPRGLPYPHGSDKVRRFRP